MGRGGKDNFDTFFVTKKEVKNLGHWYMDYRLQIQKPSRYAIP